MSTRTITATNTQGLWNGDEFGYEWPLGWAAIHGDGGWELYDDDGYGNGSGLGMIAGGEERARQLLLDLSAASSYALVDALVLAGTIRRPA